jgi:[methyl-Co(III) methanol-specific corrinoid protein]:coenzyme M methyltransferase
MIENLNSRERVLKLLKGENIDRIPVFSGMGNITIHGLEQYGYGFPEVHVDAQKMANAAASTYKLFGFECAVVPFDLGIEAEALGCKVNYYTDSKDILYPTILEKLALKIEELQIQLPSDFNNVGRIPVVTEAIRLLKEDIGDKVAIGAWVLGPFTLLGQLVELDSLWKMTIKKPDIVNGLMDIIDGVIITIADIYNKAGADYLTVREMGATESVLNPRSFNSLVKPHLERIFSSIDSPNVLHICGETNNIIGQMTDCGADAISVDQKNRLGESRKKIGSDTILLGNIDPYNALVTEKPEEIVSIVKTAIDGGVNGIWPGCDIWPTVPKQNIKAMVQATH